MEITKKDWEDVKKQAEMLLHDAVLNVEIYKSTISHAIKQIKKIADDEQEEDNKFTA